MFAGLNRIVKPNYNIVMSIDVCIRGSGVVGKSLALLLARARVRVGLVQSKAPAQSQPDIRAFALNAASRHLLQDLRAWPDPTFAVQHMRVQGDDAPDLANSSRPANQPSVVQFDAADSGCEALTWIVEAAALEQQLHNAVRFAPEITVLTEPDSAALTVLCEGKHSTTRATTATQFTQTAYGQTAIAATLRTQLPHQSTAWQWMRGSDYDGEVCALLPKHSAEEGGNFVALVWSVSDERAQHLLALDDLQFCAELQQACGHALGTMQLTSHRAAWPLHVAQASRWIGTGLPGMAQAPWALAGDAAHVVHPLAGQGLNLGLADVVELAKVLTHKEYFRSYGDMRLLRRYERARQADAAVLRLATDGLQRLFVMPDERIRSLRNWGMRRFDQLSPVKAMVMSRATGLMK
jgi:2-polyprenyl-6-methoxyphenol hydroxylase-like FAD-dependent oxidoreductase